MERIHTFARFEDGLVSIGYVYDDISGAVMRLLVTNDHQTKTLEAGVQGLGTGAAGRSREGSWGPQTGSVEISIPPGLQPVLPIIPDGGDPAREDYYDTVGNLACWARLTDG